MILLLSCVNSILLFFISGFHFYWSFGGKVGSDVVLPEINKGRKVFTPSPFATFIVACVFLLFGLVPLVASNLLSLELPYFINTFGLIGLGVLFCLRGIGEFKYLGFFKTVKGTKFAKYDQFYFSPLAFFIGIIFFVIHFF